MSVFRGGDVVDDEHGTRWVVYEKEWLVIQAEVANAMPDRFTRVAAALAQQAQPPCEHECADGRGAWLWKCTDCGQVFPDIQAPLAQFDPIVAAPQPEPEDALADEIEMRLRTAPDYYNEGSAWLLKRAAAALRAVSQPTREQAWRAVCGTIVDRDKSKPVCERPCLLCGDASRAMLALYGKSEAKP